MNWATWKIDSWKILSRGEIAAVLADARRRAHRSRNSQQNLIIFRLATCCGLRVSEIAGLRVCDVRVGMAKPHLNVQASTAKGHKGRSVPLHWDRETLADLAVWREYRRREQHARPKDPYVCTQAKNSPGRPLDRMAARKRFIRACRALPADRLERLTAHHGRHTFISHALAGGRSLAEVRDAAGHTSVAVTNVYTHIVQDDGQVGELFGFNQAKAG